MPLSKVWAGSLVLLAAVSLPLHAASPVKVGSKIDTEGALLGNIILQVLESRGVEKCRARLRESQKTRCRAKQVNLADARTSE